MPEYKERFYRKRARSEGLVSFQVSVEETDLWVAADRPLEAETRRLVLNYRRQVKDYIQQNPLFLESLRPCPYDSFAPPIVKEMLLETRKAGVGPMASVAGAIAQFVAEDLLQRTEQVVVENGGDIFLKLNRPATVSVFAGESALSDKIGVKIGRRHMPAGVCSSSGTVGHSLSMGSADAVCILARSAILADAAATALCNVVRSKKDLSGLPSRAAEIGGILGGVAVMGDAATAWGDVELVAF